MRGGERECVSVSGRMCVSGRESVCLRAEESIVSGRECVSGRERGSVYMSGRESV